MSVVATMPAGPTADELRADYKLEHNADGSAIVKLRDPVKFNGEQYTRLTIPRITGRHARRAGWLVGERMSMGAIVTFANEVIEPVGVIDELPGQVALALATEVILMLGKYGQIGVAP